MLDKKKKVLVIVAHPDDETIWMGGTLIKSKWDKTILSLCRKNDRERAEKFLKACRILKAEGFMSDLQDAEDGRLHDIEIKEVISRIKRFIDGKKYDYVFTHGQNGEYGHKRHVDVHNAVKEMLNRKMIQCQKVFFFSYERFGDNCYPDRSSDKFIRLNCDDLANKKNLIMEVYRFCKESFEEKNSRNVEAFKITKIK